MPAFIAIGMILWAIFGSPKKDLANWLYEYEPAPWETVDAFYYPDNNNLAKHSAAYGLKSLDECRKWVSGQAAAYNDPNFSRSSYLCWIGKTDEEFAGMKIYRTNAR
jgi:hypothetical protein